MKFLLYLITAVFCLSACSQPSGNNASLAAKTSVKATDTAKTTFPKALWRNPALKANFTGHASNEGSAQLNQQLSEASARAICDYLIKMGIDKNRLSHEGKGDTQPLMPNTSEAGRSLNRRVEMVVR